jgi:hypothetical protein
MRLFRSSVTAVSTASIVALINCFYLRTMVDRPAEMYEVFVYSVVQSGPFVFMTTFIAAFFWRSFPQKGSSWRRIVFVAAVVGLLVSLVLNVAFLPKVRFR